MTQSPTPDALAVIAEGRDLTLASLMPDGAPHAVVVSYAADGLTLYFGCGLDSQKARNLVHDPRVAITIALPYADWAQIRGLAAQGRARRLRPDETDAVGLLFLSKFDELAQFVSSPVEMALFEIRIETLSLLDYRKGFGHTEYGRVLSGGSEIVWTKPTA